MLRVSMMLIVIFSFLPNEAFSSELPPLGERKYLISSDAPTGPVKIQSSSKPVKEVYLRDPMNSKSGKPHDTRPSQRRVLAKKKAEKRKVNIKETKLAFKAIAVSGRTTKPRVRFVRDLIEVKRADEPLSKDFYQRVFLPASDENF